MTAAVSSPLRPGAAKAWRWGELGLALGLCALLLLGVRAAWLDRLHADLR